MGERDETHDDIVDVVGLTERVPQVEATPPGLNRPSSVTEQAELFRLFHESLPVGYQSLDENGFFLDVNRAWLDTLGYSRDEVIGKYFGDFLALGCTNRFVEEFKKIKVAGERQSVELEMVRKDGSIISVAFQGSITRHPDGRFKQTHCILQDITDRKRAESDLRKSEAHYRLLVENVEDLICTHDLEGNLTFLSSGPAHLLGYLPAEMVGTNLRLYLAPEVGDRFEEYLKTIQDNGRATGLMLVQGRTGEKRLWEYHNTLFTEPDAEPIIVGIARDVTEKERAKHQVLEAKREWEVTFDSVPDLITVLDRDHTILRANRALSDKLGLTPQEVVGKKCYRVVHGLDEPPHFCPHVKTSRNSVEHSTEMTEPRLGGVFHVTSTPCSSSNGVTRRYVHVARDITDRKKAEEEVLKSEEKFRFLTENMLDMVWTADLTFRTTYVSPSIKKLLGYSPEERYEQKIEDIVIPESLGKIQQAYAEEMQKEMLGDGDPGRMFTDVSEYYRKDGSTVWLEAVVGGVRDANGQLIGFHGTSRDVTDRKRAEEALKQAQEMLSMAIDGANLGIWDWNLTTGKTIWAERNFRMLGYEPGDFVPTFKKWEELVHREDWPQVSQNLQLHLDGKLPMFDVEFRMINKSGGWQWLRAAGQTKESPSEPTSRRIIGVVFDVTDRKSAEDELKESEERYRQLTENSLIGIFIHREDGTGVYVNPKMTEMLGYAQEEVVGTNFWEAIHPDDREMVMARAMARLKGQHYPTPHEIRLLKKSGDPILCEVLATVINDQGRPAIMGNIADITERKKLETQLIQAQKMEAVGTLAGGIAHDFNNLLQAVLGYTEIIMGRQGQGSPDLEDLKKIYNAGKRGADLVRNLLTFSRRVEPRFRVVHLDQEILEVQKLLLHTIPKTIRVVFRPKDCLNDIMADPSQVGQILMNLAVNARDAMPSGGTLGIETQNTFLNEEFCSRNPEIKPGPYVELTVSDTGHGMDEETIERIFDPFFSTKEVGKGTGLGLATVYG
ncbi:MAG: two-component system, cell cycle sensor histidine kinase and response regulator CckA, partial [Thermodesulfobacteriota bacterium]|nr:two-component system, cell cycle sensor histidine kinase and response regulator CckA [Thermodesulfobacteriota bacterium]